MGARIAVARAGIYRATAAIRLVEQGHDVHLSIRWVSSEQLLRLIRIASIRDTTILAAGKPFRKLWRLAPNSSWSWMGHSPKGSRAMADGPSYVILGRGRWAKRMQPIIAGEGRRVVSIEETRQGPSESEATYVLRLREAMKGSAAEIAWLCVAPGRHMVLMIQSAIEAGLHVVVEKPWYGSAEDTERLQALALARGRVIAVHYEYCVMEEVQEWRKGYYPGAGLRLGGRFFLSRSDQTGIPAIDNLGCHLLSIREWAVPASEVSEVHCEYERPDERQVWIEKGGHKIASIDLFHHRQPIIQRFMQKVEAALDGAAFPFDLEFALRVAGELNAVKTRDRA